MSIKRYANIADIPHRSVRAAFTDYSANQIAQLDVLRNLKSLPGGVLIYSSEVRITAESTLVYKEDGNTQCPGTKYKFTALYGLCGEDAPEWDDFYRGEARCCLVFHADLEIRDSDEAIRWGGGFNSSYVGKYRGDKPQVRWHYSNNGMKTAPRLLNYLEAAAAMRELWADMQVVRELRARGVEES